MTMRVTQQSLLNSSLERLTSRLAEFGRAQQQLGSGKRIERPSDDPIGMGRALQLRATLRAREQEARNAADGAMWVGVADAKLQGVVDRLQRARELAVRAASFTNADEHAAIAAEIGHIRDDVVAAANAKHQGRSIFAGFASGDAVAKVAGAWTYQGDGGKIDRRVGENEVVTVNVTADVAFGIGTGNDTFTVLDDLETALATSDQAGIEAAIGRIDGALSTTLNGLATLGAVANRIETAQTRNAQDVITLKSHLSEVEDIDLAQAVMELQIQESAYQAALAAFSRAQQPSLVDFLR